MTTTIREAVLSQMEDKIAAGEALSAAVEAETRAQAALEEAQAAVVAARRAALSRGWDERELKKLGLASAPRTNRGRKAKAAAPASSEAVEDRNDEDHA